MLEAIQMVSGVKSSLQVASIVEGDSWIRNAATESITRVSVSVRTGTAGTVKGAAGLISRFGA